MYVRLKEEAIIFRRVDVTGRPVCIAALLLVAALLIGRACGWIRVETRLPEADARSLLVEGRVRTIELSSGGLKVCLCGLTFLTEEGSSELYRAVAAALNAEVKASELLLLYLPESLVMEEAGETEDSAVAAGAAADGSVALAAGSVALVDSVAAGNGAEAGNGAAAGNSAAAAAGRLRIGELVRVRGVCNVPEAPTNPGMFDSRFYYLCRGIPLIMAEPAIELRSCEGRSLMDRYLDVLTYLRLRLTDAMRLAFGTEDAALINAIVLGDRSGLSAETRKLYQDGGISHILAISSLHITMLGKGLYELLRQWGRSFVCSSLVSGAFIASFCVMTGNSVSAQRACLMFLFWLLAQVTGRTCDRLTSLSAAALWILLRQPLYLWDSSFLLSFGCILSIELVVPVLRGLFPVCRKYALADTLVTSLALQAGTLPIILWFFCQVVPFSFLVNLVVLPCMSLFMAFGLLGSLAGALLLPAGQVIAGPCHYLLALFSLLCRLERQLPGAVLVTGRPALWKVVVYYAVLAAVLLIAAAGQESMKNDAGRAGGKTGADPADAEATGIQGGCLRGGTYALRGDGRRMGSGDVQGSLVGMQDASVGMQGCLVGIPGVSVGRRGASVSWRIVPAGIMTVWRYIFRRRARAEERRRFRRRLQRVCLCLLAGAAALLAVQRRPAMRVTFLDVGQGDGILVEQGRHVVLIDGGSSSESKVWEYRIASTIRYYGISSLDAILLSHSDTDHISGMSEMLETYETGLFGRSLSGLTVAELVLPALSYEDAVLDELESAARAAGIKVARVSEGDTITAGNAVLRVLSPSETRERGDANQDCMVLLMSCPLGKRGAGGRGAAGSAADGAADSAADGGTGSAADGGAGSVAGTGRAGSADDDDGEFRILFTGDLEKEAEDMLVWAYEEDSDLQGIDLLKVGHHGSRNATSERLLSLTQPAQAVISCGKNNRYGHPAQEVLDRLEKAGVQVWRTDRSGACIVRAG